MKLYTMLLLFISSGCFAQTDAVFVVKKSTQPPKDTATKRMATTYIVSANYTPAVQDSFMTVLSAICNTCNKLHNILQLPLEQSVKSCDLLYDSAGKAVKLTWAESDTASWPPMERLIDARPKGKFTFSNIVVMNGRKKIKLPDKTIEVK